MSRSDAPKDVAAFLRNEAFYVIVTIIVVVMTLARSADLMLNDAQKRVVRMPVSQEEFEAGYRDRMHTLLRQGEIEAVAPAFALRRVQVFLMWAGAGVLALTLLGGAVLLIRDYVLASPEAASASADSGPGDRRRGDRPYLLIGRVHMDPVVRPPWTLWDCFKVGTCWALGSYLLGEIFKTYSTMPLTQPPHWVGEMFSVVLLIGIILHVVLGERRTQLRDLGLRLEHAAGAIALGLVGFLLMRPLLWGLLLIQSQFEIFRGAPIHGAIEAFLVTESPLTLALIPLTAVLLVPLGEELLFRGFLQPALQSWFGAWMGLLVGAAIFGTAHAAAGLGSVLPMFILGVLLGIVYNQSRSLLAPLTLHVAHNGFTMLSVIVYRHLYVAG
jgi:hypothetical protein